MPFVPPNNATPLPHTLPQPPPLGVPPTSPHLVEAELLSRAVPLQHTKDLSRGAAVRCKVLPADKDDVGAPTIAGGEGGRGETGEGGREVEKTGKEGVEEDRRTGKESERE
eukprot:357335-Chlamydomonas_euryale.AAC.4